MSRVVVYCLEGRNMLVWRMYDGLWICIWLSWCNDFVCSGLPYFCCCVFCCVVLSFAMIIDLLVWAETRNTHGQQGDGNSAA